jgi:hypothetical protein
MATCCSFKTAGGRIGTVLATALFLAFLSPATGQEVGIAADQGGGIHELTVGGERLAIHTNLIIPMKGWTRSTSQGQASDIKHSGQGSEQSWRGRLEIDKGRFCRYEQTLRRHDNAIDLDLRVDAEAYIDVQGVIFFIILPIEQFNGARAVITTDGDGDKTITLPTTLPEKENFFSARSKALRISAADGRTALDVSIAPAFPMGIQDQRKWHGTADYGIYFTLHSGALAKGQSIAAKLTLAPRATPDTSPARMVVDVAKVRYQFDGFGGDYCFNLDAPVTQYTLDNLRVAWARIEMSLRLWAPANGDTPPEMADLKKLEANDKPGSKIRAELELARQIKGKGIPCVISVWKLPEWLYEKGSGTPDGHGRVVPREKWPQLADCVASYLLYAKQKYGVEPDLFSFNESDSGVMVLMTPQEHRDVIKLLGAHFAKSGLKTRMLLGDVGSRDMISFVAPAIADPEAMKYVGAVAFHSWGGGSGAEAYRSWAALADRLKLPLLVTELGVDSASGSRPHEVPGYWLKELRMYQELLLYARPRATMQWEFTGDYATCRWEKQPDGQTKVIPSQRFFFVQQFCNLTPAKADVLETSSDHPKVLLTALASGLPGDARRIYTLHVANLGLARTGTITGLPVDLKELRAVRTSESESLKEMDPVRVEQGTVHLDLAAESMLTLTTMQPSSMKTSQSHP